MTVSYPSLHDCKSGNDNAQSSSHAIVGNTRNPQKNFSVSSLKQKTVISPLFKLGDDDHAIILKWALHSPEKLKMVNCCGLERISDFLVSRKSNSKTKSLDSISEIVPILLAFLFFRPAVRRKLVLPSFARDQFERISRSSFNQQIELSKIVHTIKEWSFARLHESGFGFNPWIFIKLDYSTYFSATNYFLLVFSNILKDDSKLKCIKSNCGSLKCTKVHFNVSKLDQTGALRWTLRLILIEANTRFRIYQPENIERIVVDVSRRFIKDNLSSYSIVSQYVSLLILAGLELGYKSQILLGLQKFTGISNLNENYRENLDDTIDWAGLDSGRLLESCFSVLQGSIKSHKLLTVSQYGCSIGEAFMKILLDIFRYHLTKRFKRQLPFGVSRHQVDSLLSEDVPYTMAMHLWLFKSMSCLEIATDLQNLKVKGFRDIQKGVLTVENWKNAAINACNERNHKWLSLMKSPSTADLVSACETFMPNWIKAFSTLIRKSSLDSTKSTKKEISESQRRWEDEDISICSKEDDDMTDWRKIIKFLRNYYLGNTSSNTCRKTQHHLAAILNYLLHASHQLKHTDYASFDPEFFLFLAYKLFEKLQSLCMSGELQLLIVSNEENVVGSRITGLRSFCQMSNEERLNSSSQFESCKIEISNFLPQEGTYLYKWNLDTKLETLDCSLAALTI